jgi:sigma-E factor negative regulatory protein RseB
VLIRLPGFIPYSRLLVSFALVTATCAGAAVCPDTDPRALSLLDKMSRNIQQISYHGVATLQRDGDMQVLQLSHLVDQDSSVEHLTELTGQGAQVERATHPLDCIHPGQQMLRLGAALQAEDCAITRQYRLSVLGGERIAGRNAVRIEVEPRDMYRFGYVLYLDQETGLLLKSETIGRGSRVLEKFQFAHLSYNEAIPDISEVSVTHQARHPDPNTQTISAPVSRAWTVSWLPRGFMPTDRSLGISGRRTYTDGLAVFSVFLEDLNREIRPGEGLVREGGTISYTRGMLLTGEPVLVTVVGEVPVNTARLVADSIGWVH